MNRLQVLLAFSLIFTGNILTAATSTPGQGPEVYPVKFDRGMASVDVPFESVDNIVFFQCRINSSQPLWFILDSGASFTAFDSGVASGLNLDLSKKSKSPKTGTEYSVIDGVTIRIQGMEISDQTVNALSLAELGMVVGRKISGIIGYELLRHVVLEIDYAEQKLSFFDPRSYSYSGPAEKIPLTLNLNWPRIPARVSQSGGQTQEGDVVLDTGSLMALSLSDDSLAQETIPTVGIGFTGASGGRLGRVETLYLGDHVLKSPLAGFPPSNASGSDPLADLVAQSGIGLIGAEVLHRFTLILDYTHGWARLEPNRFFDDPFEMDMSGLMILTMGEDYGQYVIFNIVPGSSAEESGFQPKDIILSVDGKPAAEYGISALRELFTHEGKQHTLKINRGDEVLDIVLKLKKMI